MRWDAAIFKVNEIVLFQLTRDYCFMLKNRSLSILRIQGAPFISAEAVEKIKRGCRDFISRRALKTLNRAGISSADPWGLTRYRMGRICLTPLPQTITGAKYPG